MKEISVYLAGCEGWYYNNLPSNNYYSEWRKAVEEWCEKFACNINVINPCNYYDYKDNYHKSEIEIKRYDLHRVRNCDVVLVNLDHIKDSVGTLREMFCAEENNIPIIGFYEFNGESTSWADDRYKTEPWLLDACLRIEDDETSSLLDALAYIRNYFGS